MVRDSFIYLLISLKNNFKISLEIVLYYRDESFFSYYWFSRCDRDRKILMLV